MRGTGLALPVVIGLGLAVASCSSAPGTVNATASGTRSASAAAASGSPAASPSARAASPAASSSAAPVPVGYTRVGGAAQGISLAAPASWAAVNLAKDTLESGAKKLAQSGVSAAQILQTMQSLQKLHGIFIFDVKAAVDSPQHFAPNLSAYCVASGITDVGAAGVHLLTVEAAAELEKVGATHVTQQDLQIGGVPGVETFYQLSPASARTIYGSQLEVLPKPDKACFVTLTTGKGQSEDSVLTVAAATAQFP